MPAKPYMASKMKPVDIQALNVGGPEYKGIIHDNEMTKKADIPKKMNSGKAVTKAVDIRAMDQAPDIGGGYLYDASGQLAAKSGGLKGK